MQGPQLESDPPGGTSINVTTTIAATAQAPNTSAAPTARTAATGARASTATPNSAPLVPCGLPAVFVPFAVLVPVPVPVDAVPVPVPAPVPVPVPGADVCEPAGAVVVPLPDATMVAEPVCELASTVEFAPTTLEEKVAFAVDVALDEKVATCARRPGV